MLRSAYGKGWCCHARIMAMPFKRSVKLCLLLLISVHLQAFLPGESQVVSLSFKDAPLQKVFAEIKKQTGYSFAYSETDLAKAKWVNINLSNARMQDALSAIFQDQPLTYTIIERIIIIKEKSEKKINQGQSSLQELETIDVRGRVLNEEGDPVAGVTVLVKGTKAGTSTDGEGEFFLTKIDPYAILILTAVNIQPIEASINGRRSLDLTVKGRTGKLDEVQVIAYGITSQRLNTGNVTTVKAKDIEKQPVNNPLLALQGRVPGLVIVPANGLPGAAITVRIQGQNSISNGNEPFYVIDGVPYISQMLPTTGFGNILGGKTANIGAGNPLSSINPSDIESIEVLKDADATAIYGSRAANGAILITTKKGKSGPARLNVNMQQGWGKIVNKLDLLNTQQYLEMRKEGYINDGLPIPTESTNPDFSNYDLTVWDQNRHTDWQDVLIGGTASFININTSISGGTDDAKYLVGGTYQKQTTVFPGNFEDQKGSLHINLNTQSANKKLKLQLTGNFAIDRNKLPQEDFTSIASTLSPNAPALYNSDGTLNWAPLNTGVSTWTHPLANTLGGYEIKTRNIVGNILLSYKLFPHLEVKSSFGYTNQQIDEFAGSPLTRVKPEERLTSTRAATYNYSQVETWIIEPQLNYSINFSNHKFNVLVGSTFQQNNNDGESLEGSGYNSDDVLRDIRSATSIRVANSTASTYRYNAIFSKVGYSLRDKYLLNLAFRRDGSSRFGSDKIFENFGSLGVGWILTEEKFLKDNKIVSFAKLRGSYGTTGNDQIGDYKFLTLYNSTNAGVPYQNQTGLFPAGLSNPQIQWETKKSFDVGVQIGFFKDRVLLSANFTQNRSSNQLINYALPRVTGFTDIATNFPATVENRSWEFVLAITNYQSKNFSWKTDFNITIPKNELVSFPNLNTSSMATGLIIGQPISIERVYRYIGVDPSTGAYLVADKDGNPSSSPSEETDKVVIMNMLPKYYGGFQNSFTYKGFQFDIFFQFTKQIGRNYFFGSESSIPGMKSNQPVSVLNRWRKTGDIALVQAYSTGNGIWIDPFFNAAASNAAYSDASFIRLKNLSLSYQLPSQPLKKYFQKCSIYIHGQNLLTFTKYDGLDPETGNSSLPPLKIVTVGLNVTF